MPRNKKSTLTCCDCDQPAVYVRHTQFAGSHPFCMWHALAESDFLTEDSYKCWHKLVKPDNLNITSQRLSVK